MQPTNKLQSCARWVATHVLVQFETAAAVGLQIAAEQAGRAYLNSVWFTMTEKPRRMAATLPQQDQRLQLVCSSAIPWHVPSHLRCRLLSLCDFMQ